jgi:hypothetical protein
VIVRHREVPPARVGVADVDVDRVPLPVNAGTVGRVLEDGEDALGGGMGRVLVADGGEGVAALEEGGAHAELQDAEGDEFEGGGVREAGGGGVLLVIRVEDRIVLGLVWWEWGWCWRGASGWMQLSVTARR